MTKEYIKKNQFCNCIYINRKKRYSELSYGYTGRAHSRATKISNIWFYPDGVNGSFCVEEEDLYKIGVSDPL